MKHLAKMSVALLFGMGVCLLSSGTVAEVIKIPVGSQHTSATNVDRPALGMGKIRVLEDFGEPVQRHAPVGNPPIERWDYELFSVYFEYDHVVHSVLKGPKGTK
jgi:hypothetical protein